MSEFSTKPDQSFTVPPSYEQIDGELTVSNGQTYIRQEVGELWVLRQPLHDYGTVGRPICYPRIPIIPHEVIAESDAAEALAQLQ